MHRPYSAGNRHFLDGRLSVTPPRLGFLVMTGRSVTGRRAVMASPGPPCASQPGGSGRFQNKCEMKSIL